MGREGVWDSGEGEGEKEAESEVNGKSDEETKRRDERDVVTCVVVIRVKG